MKLKEFGPKGAFLAPPLDPPLNMLVIIAQGTVVDLHSKFFGRPFLGPIFFIFMQFLANYGQIIGWLPSPFRVGAPSGKSWIRC